MHCIQCGIDSPTCPLQQSCLAMHEKHMVAQATMGIKGDSGDGGRAIISGSEQGAGRGRVCMRREDEAPMRLTGMHGFHGAD
jgi:hypothetical protein